MNTWMRVLALVLGFTLVFGSMQIWHWISPTQEKSTQGSSQADLDLTKIENRPYRKQEINLHLYTDDKFRIAKDGVETHFGTRLHWIFVARESDGEIFRAQIGDPHAFGPIVRGRIVRLGMISSWRHQSYQENILVVLGIE